MLEHLGGCSSVLDWGEEGGSFFGFLMEPCPWMGEGGAGEQTVYLASPQKHKEVEVGKWILFSLLVG